MADRLFLTPEEVAELTGRKTKPKQAEVLRKMGIAFRINASGRPIVTVAALDGRSEKKQDAPKAWQPSVVAKAAA